MRRQFVSKADRNSSWLTNLSSKMDFYPPQTNIKRALIVVMSLIAVCLLCFFCCGEPSVNRQYEKFKKALAAGKLTEAEIRVSEIASTRQGKQGVLELIDTYLDVDQPERAIKVFENITYDHNSGYSNSFEDQACRRLSDYLLKHGDYDRAWYYYGSKSPQARLGFMMDVVKYLCSQGKPDEAVRFVNMEVMWFDREDPKSSADDPYNCDNVRVKLLNYIRDISL